MRLRLPAFLFLLVVLLSPLSAFAQGEGSMFDPIIPDECKCESMPVLAADGSPTGDYAPSAPNWGCVLKVIQNVINTAVQIAILVVILSIVYGAFIFMTRGANPGAREQGRNVIGSSLLGLLILLAAWIGVDFIMKMVYNPEAVLEGDTKLGPWNEIWASNGNDMCLLVRESNILATGTATLTVNPTGSGGGSVSASGPAACSVTNVLTAASEAKISIPPNVAAYFACIARPESTCSANIQNYCWNKSCPTKPGYASTAYGHFQVLLSSNSEFYENQACYRAAGVSGPLNCNLAFNSRGFIKPSESARLERCKRASANLACSTAAAYALYKVQGAKAWGGNSDSNSQHQKCRTTHGVR